MTNQGKCPKGHVLDPSWKICPYCGEAVTASSPEMKKTAVEGVPPELKKTVKEEVAMEREKEEEKKRVEDGRKTKILMDKRPDVRALAWLIAADGPTRASVYQILKEKATIGNSLDSDVKIDDDYASGRHASFQLVKDKYFVTDLDSANGTFVNEKRVQKKGLEDGDRVKMGDTTYVFKFYVFD